MSLWEVLGNTDEPEGDAELRRVIHEMCESSVRAGRLHSENTPAEVARLLRIAGGAYLPTVAMAPTTTAAYELPTSDQPDTPTVQTALLEREASL